LIGLFVEPDARGLLVFVTPAPVSLVEHLWKSAFEHVFSRVTSTARSVRRAELTMMDNDETTTPSASTPAPRPRGFAALSPEARRALGSKGGKVAHERGTANKFTSESGSAAGRIPHEKGTAYRWTSEEASAAGRKGAGVSRRRRRTSAPAV
jgi:hypothetical protein